MPHLFPQYSSKLLRVVIPLILGVTTIFSTCKKRFGCANNVYFFETYIKTYPDLDSIEISDTIWLELETSTQLIDRRTNHSIDFSNAENLGLGITYLELIGGDFNNPGSLPAASSFENIIVTGSAIQSGKSDQTKEYLFKENFGKYQFKVGIVPKKIGLFIIANSNAANVYRNDDECTKASFSITFKNTNQHLYLYEKSRPGYFLSEYERTHMYCFKVIK